MTKMNTNENDFTSSFRGKHDANYRVEIELEIKPHWHIMNATPQKTSQYNTFPSSWRSRNANKKLNKRSPEKFKNNNI